MEAWAPKNKQRGPKNNQKWLKTRFGYIFWLETVCLGNWGQKNHQKNYKKQ